MTCKTKILYPIAAPDLSNLERSFLLDAFDSGWLSSGPYVRQFEESFKQFIGADYVLSTANGTLALHLCLTALGIQAGDEILLPNLTFAATANAVIACGAIPVFVDVDEHWGISLEDLSTKITRKTKGIIIVHLYNQVVDLSPIQELIKNKNIYLIEDCAEALACYDKNAHHVGTLSDAACFSFFGNKLMTTGEGGMAVFSQSASLAKAKIFRNHGREGNATFDHVLPGMNYRLTNLQAAIGFAQLKRLPTFMKQRKLIRSWYRERLSRIEAIVLPTLSDQLETTPWIFSLLVHKKRDGLIAYLNEFGIESRPFFSALNLNQAFREYAHGHFPYSYYLSQHGISLPTSNYLKEEDIEYISEKIKIYFEQEIQ